MFINEYERGMGVGCQGVRELGINLIEIVESSAE